MLVVAISSTFNSSAPRALGSTLYEVGSLAVIYILFSTTALTSRGLLAICMTLTLCAAANSTVALWGAATHQTLFHATRETVGAGAFGYDATSGRSGGFVGENYAGMFNLPAIIGGFALLTWRKWRLIACGLVLLGVAGTAVSVSRASFMSCGVAILVFICLAANRLKLRTTVGIALFTALIVVVGVLAFTSYVDALAPRFQRQVNARFSEGGVENDPRAALYRIYSHDVMASPLLGKGPGYLKAQVGSGAYVYVPHNSLMDIAVEFGLPALVLFSVALLRAIRAFRPAFHDVRLSYLYACFLGMFASLLTLSEPYSRMIWALSAALFGAWRAHSRTRAGHRWAPSGATATRFLWERSGRQPELTLPHSNWGSSDS
jgi:O-antigen ligase